METVLLNAEKIIAAKTLLHAEEAGTEEAKALLIAFTLTIQQFIVTKILMLCNFNAVQLNTVKMNLFSSYE